jgi:hypothetical protein
MDVWRVDESVSQGLLEMPFSRSVVEKLEIIKDRCPCPPLHNLKECMQ